MRTALLAIGLVACDDFLVLEPHGGGTTPTADGWCGVQQVFRSDCLICHSAAAPSGELDLETDPYAAIVGVTSPVYGVVLVEPGEPEGSLVFRKMSGTQDAAEGGNMPPVGGNAANVTLVEEWIRDGASDVCATTPTTVPSGRYHPDRFGRAEEHGIEAKFQVQDCTQCHGATFEGGAGPSCASCHVATTADWTTDCSFCHGDASWVPSDAPFYEWIGAPPQDIDDEVADITFPGHRAHLRSDLHADWSCDTCHAVPTDVFSAGHVFVGDGTPGVSEVTVLKGTYAAGSCDNACHGGPVRVDDGARTCGSCHGATGDSLSAPHDKHLEEGVSCEECHPSAADRTHVDVAQKALHVNFVLDLELPATMTLDDSGAVRMCAGRCHGEVHTNRRWRDD